MAARAQIQTQTQIGNEMDGCRAANARDDDDELKEDSAGAQLNSAPSIQSSGRRLGLKCTKVNWSVRSLCSGSFDIND